MTKRYSAERVSGVATHDLPAPMLREIGRIIVLWARFEHTMQQRCWEALGVTPAQGRTAVREPRCSDRLIMLRDLIALRGATWDDELCKALIKRSQAVQSQRDLCAHGIWANREHQWFVQLTRGSWPEHVRELVSGPKKSSPELVPMTTEQLRSITSDILGLVSDLARLTKSASLPPTS
jgi:hypothetical protein